jgi:tripartite-type tricarboxylate transporter receptor subunit TctC
MTFWARLIVDHMGRHIPGNPSFIVQNMPGAGHVVAVNHLYTVAKPDGLTLIGSVIPSLYSESIGRPIRDPVRLGEVFLDRLTGARQ